MMRRKAIAEKTECISVDSLTFGITGKEEKLDLLFVSI